MAALGKRVLTDSIILLNYNRSLQQLTNLRIGRCLFTPSSLGVDVYTDSRNKIGVQFKGIEDKFKLKMKSYTEEQKNEMIFTEDLKNMVHLATEDDVDLVQTMLNKFNNQNKELRFGSFVFGPVVMRMFYYLNKPLEALQAFNQPNAKDFFNQLSSYQILLDLLFINDMYEEVVETFNKIVENHLTQGRYPKFCIVLVAAALYKLNTPEALNQLMDLWKKLQEAGSYPMRRATTFAAALAINQGAPHAAMEMLSSVPNQSYVTIRNLKIIALADVNRPEDAFPILRSVLTSETHFQRINTISDMAVQKLAESVYKTENKEVIKQFEDLHRCLISGKHISEEGIDEQLLSDIDANIKSNNRPENEFKPRNRLAASWGQGQGRRDNYREPYQRDRYRPGLREIE